MKYIFTLLFFTALTLSLQTCNRGSVETKPTIEVAETNDDFIDLAVDRIKQKVKISPEQEASMREIMAKFDYAGTDEANRSSVRKEAMSIIKREVLTEDQAKMLGKKKD